MIFILNPPFPSSWIWEPLKNEHDDLFIGQVFIGHQVRAHQALIEVLGMHLTVSNTVSALVTFRDEAVAGPHLDSSSSS